MSLAITARQLVHPSNKDIQLNTVARTNELYDDSLFIGHANFKYQIRDAITIRRKKNISRN
jgi:hypothetical protein